MEDLLLQIINECSNNRQAHLKASAQVAYDLLQSQQSLLRDPAHELRSKCFGVFQTALETRKSKFVSLALTGLHRILRDDRFQTNFEPEDDSLWLPSQFLQATTSILSQSDDTQVDILKVLLNIACSSYWTVNGRIIIQMLAMCCEVYEYGTEAVKTASQAAANQTLRAFCHLLDVESLEAKDNKMHEVGSGGIDCFNELIPILQYICSKLDEAQTGQSNASVLLLLEGLHTVVSSLPQRVHTNSHFTKFLWQKLCPVLIGLMTPPRNTNITFTRLLPMDSLPQHKIIYSIAGQLVRLVGCVCSLRPVLESVYHRMLLYPRVPQRMDSLKALTELLRSPSRLVDFAGPLLVEDDRGCQQSDMALTRLVMDSLQECSESKDTNVIAATVACIETLLSTLLQISSGQAINHIYVTKINSIYPSLVSCDYKGPLTYQTLCRLPKLYRDSMMEKSDLEDGEREEGDGTSEDSSDCSDITEDHPNSDLDENDGVSTKIGFPETLGSVQQEKIYSKESGDCERDNARHFVNTLLEFLPSILPLKYSIEIDDAIQRFASNYCQGLYYKKNRIQTDIESAIVNADGIYLATYSALSLNLKLINVGYYDHSSDDIPMTEDQFVSEVEESGVLVYLSSRWLCEVYQQVLCIDLLTMAGCEANASILNLLSDLGGIYFESEVLSDCVKLEKAASRQYTSPEVQAGLKLARRMLTCCWDSMLAILTVGVKGDQNTVPQSLHALHNAALLCNATGLQRRSGTVFSLLSNACCNSQDEKPSLLASYALSLDVLLSRSLELASHAPQSWPHVLKCCLHVSRLEHLMAYSQSAKSASKINGKSQDSQDLTVSVIEGDVASLIGDLSGVSVLPQTTAAAVLCILSHHIDRLFDDAAVKLKLNSLLSFCSAVCTASEKQLRVSPGGNSGSNTGSNKDGVKLPIGWWWNSSSRSGNSTPPPLLLTRLAQLLIKAARSGRPLIHIMKLWSAVGPHLMHASCHKDPGISKLAVTCIHDVMTTLLNENTELEHFHFNEALFKPFENLLCLELCETDIQDQVVNCICEFVEGSHAEIRSGWRPLFRALGGVSTTNHITSLLEVFQVFLNTENPLVFANAAMDFIHCLIKHVRGNGVEGEVENDNDCRSVLNFVERCSQMLCLMNSMPSCPRFNTARRLEERLDEGDVLDIMDIGGSLAVWAELLEGLASVVPLSPLVYQSAILDILFSILTDMMNQPGLEFTVYCVTFLIISSIQRWLVNNSHNIALWDNQSSSFKQYCGMTTHFVVKILNHLQCCDNVRAGTSMLEQLINAMVECVTVPVEVVARLGCACLRHIVMSGNGVLNSEQWHILVCGVERAASAVLLPLALLNSVYSRNCHRYYGDLAHIKVAARKDSTAQRNARLRHLAQQLNRTVDNVLLLESQRADVSLSANEENDDERSYVLLIYEDVNATVTKDCVSLNNLLVALLAHQMLLQTIGTILLQGTQHLIPSLAGVVSNMSDNRILVNLPEEAVDKLLNCLELSYNTAVEFDSRPGLKFLLQKVAQLDRAANLYRQAGAAWTINLIALFDLCINDQQQRQGNGDTTIREFMPKLRQSLEQLCDTYVDVLLDKDGVHSAVDRFDEKITFIIAQTDDLTDLISNTSGNSSTNCSDKCEEEAGCAEDNREELNDEEGDRVETDGSEKSEADKGDLAAEIEKQKCESICKDREAHMGVWAEMLVSAMELLCQLDDTHLKTLLPAVFPTLRSLTAYSTHSSLKHQLARVFDKLANIYGFASY
ncbi:brefeldin A-inhibited guanine nucleotide-exchange protein 3 isoform X1 [Rhodnius prolixus]|uniref:brefeldin A-inhibited guanine nucleotide-exchange protein 3 isoform X1 n=1 Tax=Rhodnius prolixus TaxID=13249 RepID=UPI003D18AD66